MTEPNDLSALYKKASEQEPEPHLDAQILAAAHARAEHNANRNASSGTVKPSGWNRLKVPVSIAAAFVVTVGLARVMIHLGGGDTDMAESMEVASKVESYDNAALEPQVARVSKPDVAITMEEKERFSAEELQSIDEMLKKGERSVAEAEAAQRSGELDSLLAETRAAREDSDIQGPARRNNQPLADRAENESMAAAEKIGSLRSRHSDPADESIRLAEEKRATTADYAVQAAPSPAEQADESGAADPESAGGKAALLAMAARQSLIVGDDLPVLNDPEAWAQAIEDVFDEYDRSVLDAEVRLFRKVYPDHPQAEKLKKYLKKSP